MDLTLIYILSAILVVSFASLAGVLLLFRREPNDAHLFAIVSFSAGTLLGAAFFDLLPEAAEMSDFKTAGIFAFLGIVSFFALEKLVLWHHHHSHKHNKPLGLMSMVGDALHNLIDGAVIAASFMVSVPLGIATTIAVLLHEIPQEIGDLSLLMYSGYSLKKAALLNLATALTAVIGGLLFYFFSGLFEAAEPIGLAFTAGMFLYIAGSDVIPELHTKHNSLNPTIQLALILLGAGVLYWLASALGV